MRLKKFRRTSRADFCFVFALHFAQIPLNNSRRASRADFCFVFVLYLPKYPLKIYRRASRADVLLCICFVLCPNTLKNSGALAFAIEAYPRDITCYPRGMSYDRIEIVRIHRDTWPWPSTVKPMWWMSVRCERECESVRAWGCESVREQKFLWRSLTQPTEKKRKLF